MLELGVRGCRYARLQPIAQGGQRCGQRVLPGEWLEASLGGALRLPKVLEARPTGFLLLAAQQWAESSWPRHFDLVGRSLVEVRQAHDLPGHMVRAVWRRRTAGGGLIQVMWDAPLRDTSGS